MTMKSWKEKFYPINASAAIDTDEMATMHSLKKWEGLLPENVKEHDLHLDGETLIDKNITEDGSTFWIDQVSCALCQKNITENYSINCGTCAIKKHMGVICDNGNGLEYSPYEHLTINDDPKPMIRLLKATLEKIRAEKKE